MTPRPFPRILQIGVGAFGQNHVRAWQELGARDHLWLAEIDANRRANVQRLLHLPAERVVADARSVFDQIDVVDVVTPTDTHYAVCEAALLAGKDVFVEKPMTMTLDEARRLHALAGQRGRMLQVGYYYRWHPASVQARSLVSSGALGTLRYMSGSFMGFKRARTDVGVTHTDAVHFIDLLNWVTGLFPERVYAVTRDHFGRGLEDFSIVILDYPGGVVAKVESGYIQPGKWRDRVVAGAMTTKSLFICGSKATVEIDFELERLDVHRVHHELRSGIWTAVSQGTDTPSTGTLTPVQMIAAELGSFLESVATRSEPEANDDVAGVRMAEIVEAIYRSARERQPVELKT